MDQDHNIPPYRRRTTFNRDPALSIVNMVHVIEIDRIGELAVPSLDVIGLANVGLLGAGAPVAGIQSNDSFKTKWTHALL